MAESPELISRERVQRYLDETIQWWRAHRDDPATSASNVERAELYVDAFQSVRESILGSCLPPTVAGKR